MNALDHFLTHNTFTYLLRSITSVLAEKVNEALVFLHPAPDLDMLEAHLVLLKYALQSNTGLVKDDVIQCVLPDLFLCGYIFPRLFEQGGQASYALAKEIWSICIAALDKRATDKLISALEVVLRGLIMDVDARPMCVYA